MSETATLTIHFEPPDRVGFGFKGRIPRSRMVLELQLCLREVLEGEEARRDTGSPESPTSGGDIVFEYHPETESFTSRRSCWVPRHLLVNVLRIVEAELVDAQRMIAAQEMARARATQVEQAPPGLIIP